MTVVAGSTETHGRAVEVEIVTRAPASRVWEALTDPARLVEWFADRVNGEVVPGSCVVWNFDRLGSEMSFRVSPLTAPGRLVFEGEGATPGRLEIYVGAAHDGTRVGLTHGGLRADGGWDDDYRALTSGWRLSLAILRYYAEFHFGQARQSFFVSRAGRFPLNRLETLLRDPSGLQEWLTEGGSMGTPGGRVHLALKGGDMLRGDMLADAGTDLAMAWDEIAGVLQLRALPASQEPDMRSMCVMGWGWGLSGERARQIEQDFGAALERLERAADVVEAGQGALHPG